MAKTVEGCLLASSSAKVKWCRAAIQRFGRVAIMVAAETKEGDWTQIGEATKIIFGLDTV